MKAVIYGQCDLNKEINPKFKRISFNNLIPNNKLLRLVKLTKPYLLKTKYHSYKNTVLTTFVKLNKDQVIWAVKKLKDTKLDKESKTKIACWCYSQKSG